MHILHIGKYYAPYLGGMETVLQEMAEGLLDEGCDITLVTAAVDSSSTVERFRGPLTGRQGRLCRVGRCGEISSQPLMPGLPGILRREIIERPPDLLHLHLPNPLAAAVCLMLRLDPATPRVPMVIWYHADITRQKLGGMLTAPLLKASLASAAGICVSSKTLKDGSSVLAPWRDKVAVIPFGINAHPWSGVEARRDGPLLFVGRLVRYKGVAGLLEALVAVPDAALDIVGDGPLGQDLQALVARLGLGHRVRFLGELDREHVAALLVHARALVLPSIDCSEAFGLVQLEAMAAGVAVVASDLPTGVRDVGLHGRTCLRVPPGDTAALARALAVVQGDDHMARQLGESGRLRFTEQFTREAMVARLLAFYAAHTRAAVLPKGIR